MSSATPELSPRRELWLLLTLAGIQFSHVLDFMIMMPLGPILMRGTHWFRSMGTVLSPGHILCTVTGDVAAHAVGEAELGRRLMDVIDTIGGGFLPRTPPKAVLNGLSSPVLTRSRLGAPLAGAH